jgi:hypothetical protein
MRHHFKFDNHSLGYNAGTERTDFYDITAVTGDFVTFSRNYFSEENTESRLFTVSGPNTLETGDQDKTVELMQNLTAPEF